MKRIFLIIMVFISLTAVYGYAHMGQGMMGPGMMNGMGWGWMIIMMAFWISLIVGAIFLVRWVVLSTNKGHEAKLDDSALEILKQRYARGEIEKDEFEEKKKDLS